MIPLMLYILQLVYIWSNKVTVCHPVILKYLEKISASSLKCREHTFINFDTFANLKFKNPGNPNLLMSVNSISPPFFSNSTFLAFLGKKWNLSFLFLDPRLSQPYTQQVTIHLHPRFSRLFTLFMSCLVKYRKTAKKNNILYNILIKIAPLQRYSSHLQISMGSFRIS